MENKGTKEISGRGEVSSERLFPYRCLISGIAGVLLAVLYGIIFQFSAQDAEQSSSLSLSISERCARIINALSGGGWSEARLAEYFEHPIRKLAHFSEYGCMGILVYTLWGQWMNRGKRLSLLTVGWVFFSAASDEFHQYFVPGRYASVADVVLDTCGGAAGVLFCVCVAALWRQHTGKKRKKAWDKPLLPKRRM